MDISVQELDDILLAHGYDSSSLIAMLQDVQTAAGHLPVHARLHLARRLGVSPARVQVLSTFYRSFSLVPTGKRKVAVCMGTACHVQGAVGVLSALERQLGIRAGGTTPDRRFTLETVRCLGCCSLAPVVRVDGAIHACVCQRDAAKILKDGD